MATIFKNRSAWIVEWEIFAHHKTAITNHDLRPHILPYRWRSEKVFVFMQCLFWNSAMFSPGAALRGINKPAYSYNRDPNCAYRTCDGARLFYGLHGDACFLVAGYVKDLCITKQSDRFIVKWTRPAGAKRDDASGRIVQDGDPIERQWIWKNGIWFCDSEVRDLPPK